MPEKPEQPTRRSPRSARSWRVATLLTFALAGGLFVTTGLNADGLDLRAGSITDLGQVVRHERDRADDLQEQVVALNDQIDELTRAVDNSAVEDLQRQVDQLRGPAGLTPVRGPGLTVVLDDAPKEARDEARSTGEVPADALVVHQQDIQAVVNALWAGGAEAMSIQDQRVVSTTGIKCVGNNVVLHGRPYSPPYRISAIGDPATLQASLDASSYVDAYLSFVVQYDLGYEVTPSTGLELPAFNRGVSLSYAEADPVEQPERS